MVQENDPGFESMWQDPKFEDMVLRLLSAHDEGSVQACISPQTSPGADQPSVHVKLSCCPEVLDTIRLNRTVLASVSNYWITRLRRWDDQADSRKRVRGEHSSLMVFEETIEPQELPVVQAALLFSYTHRVPDNLSTLMQAVRLADRWMMPGYITACLKMLANLVKGGDSLPAEDIRNIMAEDLSAAVQTHPDYQKLALQCAPSLEQLFRQPHACLANAEMRAAFNTLPFTAVWVWARQGKLQVDSENTVAMVLTYWWRARMRRQPGLSEQEQQQRREQLSSALRVQHLSASFFAAMLPQLPWFTTKHAAQAFAAIQTSMLLGRRSSEYPKAISLPPAWFAGPRQAHNTEYTYAWEVTEAELILLHQDAGNRGQYLKAPTHFFWRGFWWQPCLWLASQSAALFVGVQLLNIGLASMTCPPVMTLTSLFKYESTALAYAFGAPFANETHNIGAHQTSAFNGSLLEVPAATAPAPRQLPPSSQDDERGEAAAAGGHEGLG